MSAVLGVLLFVLKLLGWLLLGLLVLLLLLLVTPVTVKARYENSELRVRIRVLFFEFAAVDPDKPARKKKEEKEPAAEEQAAPSEKPAKEKKKLDWELIRAAIRPGGRALGFFLGSLRWSHICVRMVVAGEDAFEVGTATGKAWETVGGLFTAARHIWKHVRVDELCVIPDFLDEHGDEEHYAAWVTALPINLVIAFFILFNRIVAYKINQMKRRKAAEKETIKYGRESA